MAEDSRGEGAEWPSEASRERRQSQRRDSQRLDSEGRKRMMEAQGPQGMFGFADRNQLKDDVKRRLMKPEPYDVSVYYKTTGFWQKIARHPTFENVTLMVIAINAIWMWIDTDYNGGETPWDTHAIMIVGDQLFCVYFTFEWFARYQAFARKRDGLKDGWFKFDSLLVFLMVGETWVLFVVLQLLGGGEGGLPFDASMLRLLRLARLSRMMRMLKILRSMPELLTLIKGMGRAMKSVVYVMMLLFMLLYVFSIAMVQLLRGTPSGDHHFPNIQVAIYALFCGGTLLDGVGAVVDEIGADSTMAAVGFLCFISLAALMVMNMLIGVLCEVISAVATYEKEQMLLSYIKQKMEEVLHSIDENGDGTISRTEFFNIVADKEAITALQECDVDPLQLIEFTDQIFEEAAEGNDDDSEGSDELSFESFMDVILRYRGTNIATVADIMDYRKFLMGYVDKKFKSQTEDIVRMVRLELAKRGFGHCPQTPMNKKGSAGSITVSWQQPLQLWHGAPDAEKPPCARHASDGAPSTAPQPPTKELVFHLDAPSVGAAPQPPAPSSLAPWSPGPRPLRGEDDGCLGGGQRPPAKEVAFNPEPPCFGAPAFGLAPPQPTAAPPPPLKGIASKSASGLSPSQWSCSTEARNAGEELLLARIRQLSDANRKKILALSETATGALASAGDAGEASTSALKLASSPAMTARGLRASAPSVDSAEMAPRHREAPRRLGTAPEDDVGCGMGPLLVPSIFWTTEGTPRASARTPRQTAR